MRQTDDFVSFVVDKQHKDLLVSLLDQVGLSSQVEVLDGRPDIDRVPMTTNETKMVHNFLWWLFWIIIALSAIYNYFNHE